VKIKKFSNQVSDDGDTTRDFYCIMGYFGGMEGTFESV